MIRLVVLATLVFSLGFGGLVAVGIASGQAIASPTDVVLYQAGYLDLHHTTFYGLYLWDWRHRIGQRIHAACFHEPYSVSPNQKLIAFAFECDFEQQLYFVYPDRLTMTPLFTVGDLHYGLQWAGDNLIFYNARGESDQTLLNSIDIRTGKITNYFESSEANPESYQFTGASPDGHYLVLYGGVNRDHWNYYLFDISTRALKRLSENSGRFTWSWDSKQFAYFARDGDDVVLTIERGEQALTLPFPFSPYSGMLSDLVWSPDNRYIMFAKNTNRMMPHDEEIPVVVIDVQTGNVMTVQNVRGVVEHLVWHSDSRLITVEANTSTGRKLYTADLQGNILAIESLNLPDDAMTFEFYSMGK
jgi:Tol biopolymer transport system component